MSRSCSLFFIFPRSSILNTGLCQTLNSPHTRMHISKLLGILPQTGDILSCPSPAILSQFRRGWEGGCGEICKSRRNKWHSLNCDLIVMGVQTAEDADILPLRKGCLKRCVRGIFVYSPVSLTRLSTSVGICHWMARPEDRVLLRTHSRLLPCLHLDQLGLNRSKITVKI